MGIKGVKSGNIAKLKALSEQKLYKMSRQEKIDLLASTSKSITANVRKLKKKEYAEYVPFLQQRYRNEYPLPREIKKSTASRMTDRQLDQELRELSYTARLKTSSITGYKQYAKEFEEETGKKLTDITSEAWENIRKKIEENEYSSEAIVISYDIDSKDFVNIDEVEESLEKSKNKANNDLKDTDPFNI